MAELHPDALYRYEKGSRLFGHEPLKFKAGAGRVSHLNLYTPYPAECGG
jgi:hypothetical protein